MSRVLDWHMPENVVDQMNDVFVYEILLLEKFIRGRATGTHPTLLRHSTTGIETNNTHMSNSAAISRSRDCSSVGCHIGMSKHLTHNFIQDMKQEKSFENKPST